MRTNFRQTKALSSTKEDYVRAIYLLQKNGSGAKVTEIAKKLNLSKSTVSERIKDLAKDGLVKSSPYNEINLTTKGEVISKNLTYKHRIIEVFLNRTLKLPIDLVHYEAEKLEHAFSDEVIERLADFLGHPTEDPHGTKITAPVN